jgi:hypothetical protein
VCCLELFHYARRVSQHFDNGVDQAVLLDLESGGGGVNVWNVSICRRRRRRPRCEHKRKEVDYASRA